MSMIFKAIVLTSLYGLISTNPLPSYFPRCHIDDPKLNKCLVDAANKVKPYIVKGVKELHIPSFSPLRIDEINVEEGTRAVNVKLQMKNIRIYGMDTYKFLKMDYNPTTLEFDGFVQFDGLKMMNEYIIKGNILLAPIEGKGTYSADIGPSNASLHLYGELRKQNGVDHYHAISAKAKIQFSDSHGNFEGLFNGNKELNDATNRILEENSKELIQEFLPRIENVASDLFLQMMGAMYKIVSYEEFLPPLKGTKI